MTAETDLPERVKAAVYKWLEYKKYNYQETLIWNGLQVAIFLIMGCIKMYNSFMFVTGEYRTRIVNKTNNLEMFHNYIQSLPKEEVKTEVENEQ